MVLAESEAKVSHECFYTTPGALEEKL